MLVAVPLRVDRRVAQPEIGREIDDLQRPRQVADDFLAGGVRQGAEAEIDAREIDLVDLAHHRQVEMAQVREDAGHGLAGTSLGGHRDDLHRRMGGDQADELCARVPARPENCDVCHGVRASLQRAA